MVEKRRDSVEKGEAILEFNQNGLVVSEEAGVLSNNLQVKANMVVVGQAIGSLAKVVAMLLKKIINTPQQNEETNNKKEETTNNSVDKAEVNQTNDDNQQRINATPSACLYARENGVNLAEVSPKTNDVV